jgi:glutamate racemase
LASEEYNKPVRFGLFDSGVGGLSVFRRLHQLASVCPDQQFEFVYVGDTARCPYGNRTPEQIQQFVTQIIAFLANKEVDHVVMACNTSAAVALDHARNISPVPVHDIISPAARYVASNFRRVGVMATQSTANSKAFSKRIQYQAPEAQVFELGCPKLVPLVESGDLYSDNAKGILIEYTNQMEEQQVEAIILGCTHFPFLRRAIRDLLPASIALIDPAELLAQQIAHDLGLQVPKELLSDAIAEIHCHHASTFYTTGSASVFAQTASTCLGKSDAPLVPIHNVLGLPLEVVEGSIMPRRESETPEITPVSNVVQLPPAKGDSSKHAAP